MKLAYTVCTQASASASRCVAANLPLMASLRVVRHTPAGVSLPTIALDANFVSRRMCSSLQSPEVSSRLLELMEAFAESRELITESRESIGTVYAAEDIRDAREQTEKTLTLWKELQAYLTELGDTAALERLKREHDVKMAQLREELEDVEHATVED